MFKRKSEKNLSPSKKFLTNNLTYHQVKLLKFQNQHRFHSSNMNYGLRNLHNDLIGVAEGS